MQHWEWEKIKEVFTAVLEQPAAQRAQFLSDACGADETLRREVPDVVIGNFSRPVQRRPESGVVAGAPQPGPAQSPNQ